MAKKWKYDKSKKIIFIISILIIIISSVGIIYILLNSNNKLNDIDSKNDIKIIKDTTSFNTDEIIYNEFVLLNLDLKKYRKFIVTINNSEEVVEGIPTKIEQGELKDLDNEITNLVNEFLNDSYICYSDRHSFVIEYKDNSYGVCNSEHITLLNKLFE